MQVPEEIQEIREFCLRQFNEREVFSEEDEQRLDCTDVQDWESKKITILVAHKLHLVNQVFTDYCTMQYNDRLKFNSMSNYEKMVGNVVFNTLADSIKDYLLQCVIDLEKREHIKR